MCSTILMFKCLQIKKKLYKYKYNKFKKGIKKWKLKILKM